MRAIASPRAGLLIVSAVEPPQDWPLSDGQAESNLNHALGWACEVRKADIIVLDPLGEGVIRAPVPNLPAAWLENVRHDGSCALFVAPPEADAGFAELTIVAAGASGSLRGATVRTAVGADFGTTAAVGRNQPCPCGSGKKFKHCHG